jgi:CHAD domain-containing protein
MSYQFVRNETVGKNIRRLAKERAECAVERFEQPGDESTAIHSVRKDIKKLRAVLRLVREPLGERTYRNEMGELREIANLLAPVRDAAVKLQTFTNLIGRLKTGLPPATSKEVRKELTAQRRKARDTCLEADCRRKVKAAVIAMERRSADWKIPDEWESLSPGIHASYKCGRKSLELVATDPSAENFHEWRKRAKDLWYQLRLLRPIWPSVMESLVGELETLGEYLGNDHDLAVLRDCLSKLLKEKEYESITGIIAGQQRELRAKALASGHRIYGEKPTAFCDRLAEYWEIWKDETVVVS